MFFRKDNPIGLINLGNIYRKKGDHKNNKAALEKARAIDPSCLNLQINATQAFKAIHNDEYEIDEDRRSFAEATRYVQENPELKWRNDIPVNLGIFWLPYHGRNDDIELTQKFWKALANNRDIKKITSKFRLRPKSDDEYTSIKIGILSNFWGEQHPVSLHYAEIIKHLISTDIKVELIVGQGVSQSEQREIESRYGNHISSN